MQAANLTIIAVADAMRTLRFLLCALASRVAAPHASGPGFRLPFQLLFGHVLATAQPNRAALYDGTSQSISNLPRPPRR